MAPRGSRGCGDLSCNLPRREAALNAGDGFEQSSADVDPASSRPSLRPLFDGWGACDSCSPVVDGSCDAAEGVAPTSRPPGHAASYADSPSASPTHAAAPGRCSTCVACCTDFDSGARARGSANFDRSRAVFVAGASSRATRPSACIIPQACPSACVLSFAASGRSDSVRECPPCSERARVYPRRS